MKKMLLLIAITTLGLAGTANAQTFFTGEIAIANSFGSEGFFTSTYVVLPDEDYVESESGFFQDLNLASYNGPGPNGPAYPVNSEVTIPFTPVILSSVTPSTPFNDLITFLGEYDFNLTSLTFLDEGYGFAGYVGTGNLVDTTGQIPTTPVNVEIGVGSEFGSIDDQVPDTIYLQVVPEPSTWALLLGGIGLLAAWRFCVRKAPTLRNN